MGLASRSTPTVPGLREQSVAFRMIRNEGIAVRRALVDGNLDHLPRALAGQVYAAYTAAYCYGIDLDEEFRALHAETIRFAEAESAAGR
jgi:hypothetical protein